MSGTFTIPGDIADYLRKAAEVLRTHKTEIDRDWEIWKDEDPDPENGDFWMVKIDNPDADRLRTDLAKIADFLIWLAQVPDAAGGAQ